MIKADLHCHSTLSDGHFTLPQLVQLAQQQNITHLCLTDHETCRGYGYLRWLCKDTAITPILGCELSCKDPDTGRFVHILVYNPKDFSKLGALCAHTANKRLQAGLVMLSKVQALYPDLRQDKIIERALCGEGLYKTHIMAQLVEQGYTDKVMGDLFGKLLTPSGSCFEPIDYPSVYDVLPLAKDSGGKVVLAHPSVYKSMDLAYTLAQKQLVDGLEVHHPRNKKEDILALVELADKHGLFVTGGTDFHGHNSTDLPLGSGLTPKESLDIILKNY